MDIEGTDYSVNAVPDSVLRGLPTTAGLTELAQERQEDLDEKHCSDGTDRQLDTFLRTGQTAVSMTMDDANVVSKNVWAAGKLETVKSRQSVNKNAESPADVLFTNIGLFSHVKQGDTVQASDRNFLSEYCDGNSTDWKSKCSSRISLEKIVHVNKAPNKRKEKNGILNTVDNKETSSFCLEKQRGGKKKKLKKTHCSGFPKRSSQEVVARIVAKMRATRMWSGVKKCAEKYCLCLEKPAYMQWCQLGHKEGLKSDTEIAIFLLRLYQNSTEDDKCRRQCSQCQGPLKMVCTTCFVSSKKDLKKDDSDSKTAHADMLPVEGTSSVISECDQGRPKLKLLEGKWKVSSRHREASEVHEPLSASNVWADTAYQTEDYLTDESDARPIVRCGSSRNNRLATYSGHVIPSPISLSVDGAKGSTSLQVMEASPGETENVSFMAASGLLDSLAKHSAEQHEDSCVQGSKYDALEVESDAQTDVESEEALMADLEQVPDAERQSMAPKSEEKWDCSVCAKTFLSSDSFRKHRRTHADPRPYRCRQCMASFSQSGSLSRHARLHERETPSARDKPFKCSFCGTTFTQASSLRRHMRVRAGAKACKGRRYQVRLSKALGEGSAAAASASAAGGKVYNCDQCWKQLSSAGNLKTHLKTHSSERPHACTLCPAAFKLAGSLKSHMKTHTDQRPFMCELCGARTKRSSDLALHMRTHSEERPFRCQQCQTPFKRSCDLLFHARTAHSSHKPFKCQECDAAFKRPVDLAVHKRKHTGERPFVCEQCGAAFAQSSNLSLHLRSHSDDKPFQCQECGAEFKLPGHLRRHLKTHGGEIACKQCGITFTSAYGLSIHMKRHKAD